ncbi:MAG: P-loop NTPase family protein [Methylovirgula sp.]
MVKKYAGEELQELDRLVGPTSVKEEIGRLAQRLVNEKHYRALGVSILPARRHLVFSGPAGVAKSRVARIFGRICYRLGTLDKGHMVILDRADLTVASFDEKVAIMRAKCEAALDGILYIRNEAFLPAGILRSTGDLRLDAVDVMIEFMARHRSRMIVVLDARPNQLHYISFHSGLARQFTETIDFPAHDALELMHILAAKAEHLGLDLPDGLENDLMPWIAAHSRRHDWRNAHEIADLFSRALGARAARGVRARCADLGGFHRSDFKHALNAVQANGMVNAVAPMNFESGAPQPSLP